VIHRVAGGDSLGSVPTRFVAFDLVDPSGTLQLCCPARSVTWTGLKACHCFLKLSDDTTYGGYWKPNVFSLDTTWGLLQKRKDFKDDKYPTDKPDCRDVPGNEYDVRRAFAALAGGPPF
jgi:hypothetical protein